MMDCQSILKQTKRPKLLMQAARHYMAEFQKTRRPIHTSSQRLFQMIEDEKEFNFQRRRQSIDYCPAQHIEVLATILMMADHMRNVTPLQ